ncbi:MAG: hypothetical protein NFCOHLIN_03171 [Gammaproteobacteria bacterium]|nr:hypothetical protein [Gammaproteobacteria bacterium]
MTRYRPYARLVVPTLLAAAAANALANDPAQTSMARDPMYMAVYGPGERVAAIDVERAVPAAPPVAIGSGDDDDYGDFVLNEVPRRNPFQAGDTGD